MEGIQGRENRSIGVLYLNETWSYVLMEKFLVRASIEICFCQVDQALAFLLGIPEKKRERREEHKRIAAE